MCVCFVWSRSAACREGRIAQIDVLQYTLHAGHRFHLLHSYIQRGGHHNGPLTHCTTNSAIGNISSTGVCLGGSAARIKCPFQYAMWQRGYAFALGVEDGAEKSAENDLGRCDLHGRQIRQVVFERPLRLQLGNVERHTLGDIMV